jgi:hypothetical protein
MPPAGATAPVIEGSREHRAKSGGLAYSERSVTIGSITAARRAGT